MRSWPSAARSTARMGGSLLTVKNRDYFFDHTSQGRHHVRQPAAVGLPAGRPQHLYDVFQLFDYADSERDQRRPGHDDRRPAGAVHDEQRPGSRATEQLAGRPAGRKDLDEEARLRLLYAKAYGRPPTAEERARAGKAVGEFEQLLREREADAGRRLLAAPGRCCVTSLSRAMSSCMSTEQPDSSRQVGPRRA